LEFYAIKQREDVVCALTESTRRVGGGDGAAARMGIIRTYSPCMKKLGINLNQYSVLVAVFRRSEHIPTN
jgi:hypothetical protein